MYVLVVDDQAAIRTALGTLFELHDLPCLTVSTPEAALDAVRRQDIGVVVQDMNFTKDTTSGGEGAALLSALKALDPELPVILLTAWTSLEAAVRLIKEGAQDYLQKPWDDGKLVIAVRNALRLRQATQQNRTLRGAEARAQSELRSRHELCGLIYRSRVMQDLIALAVKVAPSDAPVLITGPNGSGKERLAEIVKANSRRADKPFISVNAGGLPDQLLEAELFGAEAGSFTGATKLRVGRFEAADGGTLFLDELGNLSAAGQMKLLRVLQTGEFQRLGSNTTRKVDVRIVSATNADLPALIARGAFREDLYFRLNVIELALPPLCQRRDDILPLAEHFLGRFDPSHAHRLSSAARQALEEYDFPGNVRELENRVQRAVLVGNGEITPADLGLVVQERDALVESDPDAPDSVVLGSESLLPDRAGTVESSATASSPEARPSADTLGLRPLEVAERALIEAALEQARGVVSRAAADLGLSRQALYRRMERLGISLERRVR